jgi:nucleoside-diphosphate-sugar epimerase
MDRKPSRDYLYIADLLEAIHRSVDLITSFDIFNIGTGKSFSVEALINTLGSVVGRDLKVISANSERPSEVNFTQADINHAIDVLRWEPQWSLFDGLSKIWNSHQTVEK